LGSFLDSFTGGSKTETQDGDTVTVFDEKDGQGVDTQITEPEKTEEVATLIADEPTQPSTDVPKKSADLTDLNEKIKTDPQLRELVLTFKKLKSNYQDLTSKYTKLDKAHSNLKKSLKKPTAKSAATGTTTGSISSAKKPVTKANNGKNTTAATHNLVSNVTPAPAVHTPAVVNETFKKGPSKAYAVRKMENMQERLGQVQNALRVSNPFYLMGAYPEITLEYFNSYPAGRPFYNKWNYGLYNDEDYCELADFYNLAHPENMFTRRNFFTDYAKNGLVRDDVMRKIGFDLSWKISKYMPREIFKSRSFHIDPRVNNYFTKRVDLHIYHEMGKHFGCATQMYNHIPGHGVLKRKDLIVDSVDTYAELYKEKSQCFNKQKFFPYSYRLYIEQECKAFFEEIHSKPYLQKAKVDPIQYVIKVGFGAHKASGVFLLDQEKTVSIEQEYQNGTLCGALNQSLIAQTYVTNPLVLDYNNKFDFRVYMLVASTNPMIAFYHDGFLRVSLHSYDKFSNDRSTHLTNTHLSKDIFAEVTENNQTLHGMNEEELRNYQMWTFERLHQYLMESGKVKDPNWLDNYLRPKFREAFVHTLRMTAKAFWKGSNVYEMFGLDFMLDDELNLWFIECNSSPQLIGTNEHKTQFLIKMLRDLFEIQYAYYRSRMTRVMTVIRNMQDETKNVRNPDYTKYKIAYAEAAVNRLEPEYTISAKNGFVKIMDENLKGPAAYFGNLKDECVIDY